MKIIALLFALGCISMVGCTSTDNLGKIGPDYSGNSQFGAAKVQNMHSSIQRGSW